MLVSLPRRHVAAPPADTATGRVTIAITDMSMVLAASPDDRQPFVTRTGRSTFFGPSPPPDHNHHHVSREATPIATGAITLPDGVTQCARRKE